MELLKRHYHELELLQITRIQIHRENRENCVSSQVRDYFWPSWNLYSVDFVNFPLLKSEIHGPKPNLGPSGSVLSLPRTHRTGPDQDQINEKCRTGPGPENFQWSSLDYLGPTRIRTKIWESRTKPGRTNLLKFGTDTDRSVNMDHASLLKS